EHDRDLAPVNQVVEDVRRANVTLHVLESLTVVEDHQAGLHRRVVLSRHVHPIGVLGSGIRLAWERVRPADVTRGYAVTWKRVGTELVMNVGVWCWRCRWWRGWRRRLLRERSRCGRGENHYRNNISTHRLSP